MEAKHSCSYCTLSGLTNDIVRYKTLIYKEQILLGQCMPLLLNATSYQTVFHIDR